jgi:uncharacterized protein (DUF58 family)
MQPEQRRHLEAGERAGSHYVLAAPRRIPLGGAGVHLGVRTGSSLEFEEHRAYQPGDDLRHIDWHVFARSDQLTVKLYHEEVSPHLDLVLDTSLSMDLEETAKSAAALGLAGLFSAAADNAGFSNRVWIAGEGCEALPGGVDRAAGWQRVDFAAPCSLDEAFRRQPPAWRPRGLRVLISDLLWDGDPLHVLAACADRATAVVVVQVLAAADVNPPAEGNLRLVDVETGGVREVYVDAAARQRYREALARHQENWHQACRQVGGVFTTVVAEELLRDWRLDALVAAEILRVA